MAEIKPSDVWLYYGEYGPELELLGYPESSQVWPLTEDPSEVRFMKLYQQKDYTPPDKLDLGQWIEKGVIKEILTLPTKIIEPLKKISTGWVLVGMILLGAVLFIGVKR